MILLHRLWYNQARKWIRECLQNHESRPSKLESSLPRRVLDVGSKTNTDLVRLHATNRREIGTYCALSYRWGGPQWCILSKPNLEKWRAGLSVRRLPRTLRDAVEGIRRLGIRYLWVDALCIKQDDPADKAREIRRMRLVYRNATVTIAASNTCGVSEGFLSTRKPLQSCTLPFLTAEDRFGRIQVLDQEEGYTTPEPLDSRGWALQEYILSSRVLMYGTHVLTWHCQANRYHPITPNYLTYNVHLSHLPRGLLRPRKSADIPIKHIQRMGMGCNSGRL